MHFKHLGFIAGIPYKLLFTHITYLESHHKPPATWKAIQRFQVSYFPSLRQATNPP